MKLSAVVTLLVGLGAAQQKKEGLIKKRVTFEGKEYAGIEDKVTWEVAAENCQDLADEGFPNGRLVTLESWDEYLYIRHELNWYLSGGSEYWLGYRKLESHTPYLPLSYGVTGELEDGMWYTDEPSSKGALRGINCLHNGLYGGCYFSCFYFEYVGSVSCFEEKNYICERVIGNENPLPVNTEIIEKTAIRGNKEYALLREELSFDEAIEACSSLDQYGFPVGEVVVFQTKEDFEFTMREVSPVSWTPYQKELSGSDFVASSYGIKYHGASETDSWDDNEPSSTGASSENINCVQATSSGLRSVSCNEKQKVVCQRFFNTVSSQNITTPPNSDTEGDLPEQKAESSLFILMGGIITVLLIVLLVFLIANLFKSKQGETDSDSSDFMPQKYDVTL